MRLFKPFVATLICVSGALFLVVTWFAALGLIFFVILRPGSDVSLRSSLPGNLPGGTHRGWQNVLLLFSRRTVVTCFPSNRTIFLILAVAKLIQHTARLGLPIPMLCLPSCSRRACILKERHLVYAKLLPSGFPIFIFLLLRIECMSFVFYNIVQTTPSGRRL